MPTLFTFNTRSGIFSIEQRGTRWHVLFRDENLGSYHSAQAALGDLVGGHTFTASCGDTSRLGLPEDLSEWRAIR